MRLYKKSNEAFVSKVKKMSDVQTERLMTEYSNREKILIYYGQKKKKLGSAAIYVTDNFLFIPGLLLVLREELEKIELVNIYATLRGRDLLVWTALFPISRNTEKKGLVNIKCVTRIDFVSLGIATIFPLDYNYGESPKTAEQIMAWFWQCEQNDPALSERTKSLVTDYYS